MTISDFDGTFPLISIPPAATNGTILEIQFGLSTDDVEAAGGNGFVVPCSPSCQYGPFIFTNIELKQRRFEPFTFDAGDTLRLVSRGDTWVEVSRSSGHVEAFNVVVEEFVPAGFTSFPIPADCAGFIDPLTGRAGAILLTSSVTTTNTATVEIVEQTIEVIAGTEVLLTTVENLSPFLADVEITLRCLSI